MGTPHFGHGRWAGGGGVGLKLWGRGMTRYSVTLPVPDKSLVRVGASRPITNSYRFAGLIAQGAQAIILNWTEIMLLVLEEDSAVPLFATTTIHAIAAVDRALA